MEIQNTTVIDTIYTSMYSHGYDFGSILDFGTLIPFYRPSFVQCVKLLQIKSKLLLDRLFQDDFFIGLLILFVGVRSNIDFVVFYKSTLLHRHHL